MQLLYEAITIRRATCRTVGAGSRNLCERLSFPPVIVLLQYVSKSRSIKEVKYCSQRAVSKKCLMFSVTLQLEDNEREKGITSGKMLSLRALGDARSQVFHRSDKHEQELRQQYNTTHIRSIHANE